MVFDPSPKKGLGNLFDRDDCELSLKLGLLDILLIKTTKLGNPNTMK